MHCESCNREISDGSAFCPLCGKPQIEPTGVEQTVLETTPQDLREVWRGITAKSAEPLEEQGGAEGWEGADHSPQDPYIGNLKAPGFTIFSPNGKLNRLKYLYFFLIDISSVILLAAGLSYAGIGAAVGNVSPVLQVLYYPFVLMLFAIRIITMIKRFHDMNKPGYHVLLLLVPFYNFYIFFQLLLAGPDAKINVYGGYERRNWYWQVPLAVLLLPVIYFFTCFGLTQGSELLASLRPDAKGTYYYNEQYQVGMTLPVGWKITENDKFLVTAYNWDGSQAIVLDAAGTDLESFSEYTDQDFEALISSITLESYATSYGYDTSNMSGFSCGKSVVNGYPFLKVSYFNTADSTKSAVFHIYGVYNSAYITVTAVYSEATSADNLNTIYQSIDSLQVGTDAEKENGE